MARRGGGPEPAATPCSRAYYTEVNAKLVSEALGLGPVEYLSPEEAHAALAIEKEIERPWRLWKAAARGK